jgi:hypothetical protein
MVLWGFLCDAQQKAWNYTQMASDNGGRSAQI